MLSKKYILLTFIILGTLSCTNSEDVQQNQFVGIWNWNLTEGGVSSQIHETPTSTGNTIELIITNDFDYIIVRNGSTESQGNYEIHQERDIYTDNLSPFISFSENANNSNFIIFNGIIKRENAIQLSISDNNFDGTSMQFEKR